MIDEAHSTVLAARATASSLLFFAACGHRCMDMEASLAGLLQLRDCGRKQKPVSHHAPAPPSPRPG